MEAKGVQEKSECVAIPLEQEEDGDSSSPHVPSRFLCPSNLGALLESTTVSLVAGGWKETSASGIREAITSLSSEVGEIENGGPGSTLLQEIISDSNSENSLQECCVSDK